MRPNLIGAIFLGIFAICQPADGSNTRHSPVIELTLMGAGIVKVEGRNYSDAQALRGKLVTLKQRRPRPELKVVLSRGINFQSAAAAMALLQRTGEVKLGVVNTRE